MLSPSDPIYLHAVFAFKLIYDFVPFHILAYFIVVKIGDVKFVPLKWRRQSTSTS